jgi:hypothetical protein
MPHRGAYWLYAPAGFFFTVLRCTKLRLLQESMRSTVASIAYAAMHLRPRIRAVSAPDMEAVMNVGQKVRVRPTSRFARDWKIPQDAQGLVTCKYRLLKESQDAPDRLDVRFGQRLMIWGAPAEAFEPIAERT